MVDRGRFSHSFTFIILSFFMASAASDMGCYGAIWDVIGVFEPLTPLFDLSCHETNVDEDINRFQLDALSLLFGASKSTIGP